MLEISCGDFNTRSFAYHLFDLYLMFSFVDNSLIVHVVIAAIMDVDLLVDFNIHIR
jgi:hypothetical protein